MNLAAYDIVIAMVTSSLKNLIPFALILISVTTRLIKKNNNMILLSRRRISLYEGIHVVIQRGTISSIRLLLWKPVEGYA
jgi:hypothetical protein